MSGVSLTRREARIVMGRLAGGMVQLVPFHSLVSAYCHMVHHRRCHYTYAMQRHMQEKGNNKVVT